ncbi:organic cation/carnitine transporter 7-like isoform X2 [Phragmites australis]|nr:organic cation/carnitine transporter 7-like isoform X2 [Phragmites australis]
METYTTDDALTAMGFGRFQALVLVYAGTGWLTDAMELMLLSFLGPLVRQQWNVSPQHESLLSSVVFAGMLIGACAWGFLSDKYGRRTALLFSILLTTGAGLLSALSPNYISLLALRFLVGVGVGGAHVFSSWFLEFVPAKNRGAWMIVFSFFWTIGTILEASLAWVVIEKLSWRWLLAFTALPCFLLLLFFAITPESPRYLCVQNRMSKATLVLERMAKANKVALPPGVLTYHRDTQTDHIMLTSEDDHLHVRENECTVGNAMSSKPGGIPALRMLLSRKLVRSTLLIWFVWFANSFAYYGLVLLTSQLSDANRRCASGKKIEAHQKDVNLYKDVFITSLAEFPGLIISAVIVDWFGRKATMWIMMFACCSFLGPLVVHQNESLTTALLFGARACGMGSSTVLCLYAPEVYPTSARSTGVGIATAIGKIGGIVCPLIAVGMLRSCHQMEAVVVFELVLGLAGVACILFPVETKGREMK